MAPDLPVNGRGDGTATTGGQTLLYFTHVIRISPTSQAARS